jgi:hypothetical protein
MYSTGTPFRLVLQTARHAPLQLCFLVSCVVFLQPKPTIALRHVRTAEAYGCDAATLHVSAVPTLETVYSQTYCRICLYNLVCSLQKKCRRSYHAGCLVHTPLITAVVCIGTL